MTVEPDMVATDVLLLVYVKAPPLLEVGAVKVNGEDPKFLDATVKLLRLGAI